MKTMWRKFWKTMGWLLGTVAVLTVAMLTVNAFDEELQPETVALLKAPSNPYAPDENLYIALVGFDAPEGQSGITVGQARVAEHEIGAANVLQNPEKYKEIWTRLENHGRLRFNGTADFCQPLESSCWTNVENHGPEISSLRDKNRELYRRYLALHKCLGYFEVEPPIYVIVIPNLQVPTAARALFLSTIALHVRTGASDQARNAAISELQNDIDTWRRMLVGNGGIFSKILAIVNLHGDYVLLADMIADPSNDLAPFSMAIEDTLSRVEADDWKLHNAYLTEFRSSAPLFEQVQNMKTSIFQPIAAFTREEPEQAAPYWGWIQGHFLKVNATQNMSARVMIEFQKEADADPRDFLKAREVRRDWTEKHLGYGPSFVYNPVGKMLVAMKMLSDEDPLRAYDIAAYARGVRLAYEIRKHRIPAKDIPAFSRQHPEWSTHPVSGAPLTWDPQAHELRVEPLARMGSKRRAERRYNIPVWTAPGW